MDSKDVTCTFSIFHGRGAVCLKIQEVAVETDRKESPLFELDFRHVLHWAFEGHTCQPKAETFFSIFGVFSPPNGF